MADTVVNFLVENLSHLLSENIDLIRGMDDEFKNLLEEVQRLKAFLDDADSNLWDQLEKEIQKILHKAEDEIDKFLVQAKLHREEKEGRSFDAGHLTIIRAPAAEIHDKAKLHREEKKVGRFFDVGHLTTIRALAAEIHDKVKKLREDYKGSFRPILDIPKKEHRQVTQGSALDDDEVVGFNEEAKILIKRLFEGPAESLDIIPVMGMSGLGKTTLLRKIYNDREVSFEFVCILWVYVGQEYKMKDIFLTILKFFTKRIEEYLNKDEDTLAQVIRGFMDKGDRCLIVLDDVWEARVVDQVRKVFPENQKGHRIIMTTRDRRLAAYTNPYPHDLKFLTAEESFELLVKRVFGKVSCPYELVELGKQIAQSCGGVPFAVVVIAGVLAGRLSTKDWQMIGRNMAQYLYINNRESFLEFVELSYNHLPQEVQTCFLYCGIFPRGFEIPSWKLIRMWIAEGLIKPQQSYTLEEIAELHLNDLVHRNLVILLQKSSDGKVKTCRLHDKLHEFCRTKATDKWLFQEICTTAYNSIPSIQNPHTCRRLCIQPSTLKDFLSTKPSAEHVRTFCCFSSKEKQIDLSPNDINLIHRAFPLLRILDVESLKFLFSKYFNQLFHLRYVATSGDFKVLPPTFGKFWNLQTLVINTSTSESTFDVKADIWNLLRLRHLHTNVPAKLPSPTTTSGKASSLQTLSMVSPESCKKDVLAKACFLKKLSIRGPMAAFLESRGGISNLEELRCLEHLKLLNDVLNMNEILQLPAALFRLVRTIKKLTLVNTRFAWSEAEKLGQLEALEVLKLKENSFMGETWNMEIGGFSKLLVLWIERAELETWEASNHSFPILRQLVIVSCDKLNAVPLELADIPNLQEMKLEYTSKAVKSAKYILERKKSENRKFNLSIFPQFEQIPS